MKSTNLTPKRLICIFHYIITFPPFHTTIRLKSSDTSPCNLQVFIWFSYMIKYLVKISRLFLEKLHNQFKSISLLKLRNLQELDLTSYFNCLCIDKLKSSLRKVVENTLPDGCKAKSGVVTKQTLMYTYSVAVTRRRITKTMHRD